MLYPSELQAHSEKVIRYQENSLKKTCPLLRIPYISMMLCNMHGVSEGIRTPGHQGHNLVL